MVIYKEVRFSDKVICRIAPVFGAMGFDSSAKAPSFFVFRSVFRSLEAKNRTGRFFKVMVLK